MLGLLQGLPGYSQTFCVPEAKRRLGKAPCKPSRCPTTTTGDVIVKETTGKEETIQLRPDLGIRGTLTHPCLSPWGEDKGPRPDYYFAWSVGTVRDWQPKQCELTVSRFLIARSLRWRLRRRYLKVLGSISHTTYIESSLRSEGHCCRNL